jgi:ectoine hydroxylase-related dioxygenase (phytanoyl-CoA dioxygenase family)
MPKSAEFDQSVLFATPETARAVLSTYGVAIVPAVLSPEKCTALLSKMWDFFEDISANMPVPIRRDDRATWPTLLEMCTFHCMLFQHWGVGHAEFMWWLRQQPEVYNVFAHVLRTDASELLVSFDGASFQAPPDRADNPRPNAGWGAKKHWFHQDQATGSPDFLCVQGWVTALPVEPDDATLCVLARSHLMTRQLVQRFPRLATKQNWVPIDDEAVAFLKQCDCQPVRVECPAGSLVLWDSRTVHYGAPPVRGRTSPKFRAVCYVSYLPRHNALPRDIAKKIDALANLRTTSHWAYPVKLFSAKPRLYGAEPPKVAPARPPVLNRMGRLFAGFYDNTADAEKYASIAERWNESRRQAQANNAQNK